MTVCIHGVCACTCVNGVRAFVHACVRVCMHTCVCVCACVHAYVCMHARTCYHSKHSQMFCFGHKRKCFAFVTKTPNGGEVKRA